MRRAEGHYGSSASLPRIASLTTASPLPDSSSGKEGEEKEDEKERKREEMMSQKIKNISIQNFYQGWTWWHMPLILVFRGQSKWICEASLV